MNMCTEISTEAFVALLMAAMERVSYTDLVSLRNKINHSNTGIYIELNRDSFRSTMIHSSNLFGFHKDYIERAPSSINLFGTSFLEDNYFFDVSDEVLHNLKDQIHHYSFSA